MKKYYLLALGLAFISVASNGQSVNWAKDVAPILYNNCVKCHRDGGIGHFSLLGYDAAYANFTAIADATGARRMPPWKPDPNYRHFAAENKLSDAEIQTIKAWADAGAPPGDLNQAPPDPVFPTGSEVGVPDQVLHTPYYTVTATTDEYRCFVIPNGLSQDVYLRGLEAIPSNHEVVHHILIYEDTTNQSQVLDAQTPEPGYVNFGGPGVSGARLVGAWVPGSKTLLYPPNMGVKLHAGAHLVVQVHYPAGVTGKSDVTALNMFFTPTTQGVREVFLSPLLNHTPLSLINGPLNIPANTIKTYHAKFKVPINASAITVAPHMHLIGRDIVSFAVSSQGDTTRLIHIPNWDFHWQGAYMFQKVQKITAGTTLHAYAVYDNTVNNPNQPSSPPKNVVQGEATTDEMLLVYFAYMYYLPGDENIVLDSTLLTPSATFTPDNKIVSRVEVFPNPAQDKLSVDFDMMQTGDAQAAVVSLDGKVLKIFAEKTNLPAGTYRETALISDLPPGMYFVSIRSGNNCGVMTKFVKQ
jgi:mono/diheme cytochrome c family protein